jgi:hypothetical protein
MPKYIPSLGMSNPMTTQGDMISGGVGGEPKRLAPGTSGQFLKTQGAGADPVWADVPVTSGYTESIILATSNGNVYSTGVSISITTGQKLFAIFCGYIHSAAGYSVMWYPQAVAIQDNASDLKVTSAGNIYWINTAYSQDVPVSVCILTSPEAGSHTIRIRYYNGSTNQGNLYGQLVVLVF